MQKGKSSQSSHVTDAVGFVRPIRRVAALLGFLQKMEVDSIFKQQPFETIGGNDPLELWRQYSTRVSGLPPLSVLDVEPLPASLYTEIESIKTWAAAGLVDTPLC